MQATPPPKPEIPSDMPKIPRPAALPHDVDAHPAARLPFWLIVAILMIAVVILTLAVGKE